MIDHCGRCDLPDDECAFCRYNPQNQADEDPDDIGEYGADPFGTEDSDEQPDIDPDDESNYSHDPDSYDYSRNDYDDYE